MPDEKITFNPLILLVAAAGCEQTGGLKLEQPKLKSIFFVFDMIDCGDDSVVCHRSTNKSYHYSLRGGWLTLDISKHSSGCFGTRRWD